MPSLPVVNHPNEKILERPHAPEIPVELESAYLAPSLESVPNKLVTSIEVTPTPQAWRPSLGSFDLWDEFQSDLLWAGLQADLEQRELRRAASNPYPHPRANQSHARAVHRWCIRHGLYYLGDLQLGGMLDELPKMKKLASFLWGEVYTRGRDDFITLTRLRRMGRVSKRGATWNELDRLCVDAAEWLIENYDPGVLVRAQVHGRKGGKVSKRPPRWKGLDLDKLAQLDEIAGMTATRKAKELGVGRSTYYRMRDALDARSRIENWPTRPTTGE